ncbi:S9 family peptidase [Parerythrobacter aurantius]|uniref:S9 family peptidase n=1 Tax=Parerythrobacter aurantius TaxID=3127706 RepID=UPI0032435B93
MKTLRTALFTATLLIPAAALARPMTPEDVAKLEAVGTFAVSPDGSRIAFTTASLPDVTEGEDDGATKQELKLAWGPEQWRAYLPADVSPGQVGFSPDGLMVTYLWAAKDEKRAVWGVPVDGGAPRKLAGIEDAGVSTYAFAPDGSTVYLLAGAAPDKTRDAEKKKGFDAVVYEEEAQLNRLFAATIGAEPDAKPREIKVPGYVSTIDIFPDGKRAMIKTAPSPRVDDEYTSTRVNILDLATGKTVEVATPGKLEDVEIAPDGSALSLIAAIDRHDPAATTLFRADPVTGTFAPLNEGAAEAAVDAEWLADGRLAAVIHKGTKSVLRIYGSTVEEIDPGALVLAAVESAGDRIAVLAHSARHPVELFTLDSGSFQRWTSHNPWLAEIDFGTQRTVRYTARDGRTIEGVLIEPVGGAPKGGAPLIMNVHGGPEAHESDGWQTAYSKPGQVAAGKGYAVFLPNYRGSTGYGVAFAKEHQGDYGGKEFDDIVDAKRYFVAEGLADADRVGITGGSYGGYASAWGATFYSAEYAASVMFVGISNNISKFGTTDIPNEMYLVHERKWPWEEWDHLLERSPIFHVDKADTPILIMHGDSDTRVSPTQSYELYRNIKTRKPEVPVRLVLYPGEPHGNRRAASRYDYNLRMMEWFDTYLKTGDRDAPLPAPRPDLGLEKAAEAE